MQDLGYGSHSSILNLGSIALFSFVYYLRVAFYFFVLTPAAYLIPTKKYKYKVIRLQRRMKKTLFFSEILTLSMEAYIEFLIAGYLNLKVQLVSTSGELASVAVGYYAVILCLVVIPLCFIHLFRQSIFRINDPRFNRRWHGLFEGVDTRNKLNLLFNVVFCLRRLIFVHSAFYLSETPTFQIQSIILINLFSLIYKGNNNPQISRFSNRIELFNEAFVCIVTLHLMFYTDWVPDSQTQFEMGFSMIGFMIINFAVNLFFVFYFAGHQLKLVGIKSFNITKNVV